MAIFTSLKKYFEVTAVSFTPNIITVGEETSYEISIKNVSGKKITSMRSDMKLYYRDSTGVVRGSSSKAVYSGNLEYGFKSISWSSGGTQTFTGKFVFEPIPSYPANIDTRLLPLYRGSDAGYQEWAGGNERLGLMLNFTTNAVFADGGNTDVFFDLRGEDSENLYVIDKRYRPSILAFSAERSEGASPHDEGENVLAGMQLALGDNTHRDRLSLQFRYRDNAVGGAYTSIDISTLMQHALSGSITALIQIAPNENLVLGKNSDWDLVLWYGDQFESAVYPARNAFVLPRSFANMHLSGRKNGGVCFGSFSKATDKNPLFQCYYPAEFEEGIKGGFTYELGEVRTGGKWIDGKDIFRQVAWISVDVVNKRKDNLVEGFPQVSTLIDLRASLVRDAEDSRRYPAQFWYADNNYHSVWLEYPDSVSAKTSHTLKGYVIIEYTKV